MVRARAAASVRSPLIVPVAWVKRASTVGDFERLSLMPVASPGPDVSHPDGGAFHEMHPLYDHILQSRQRVLPPVPVHGPIPLLPEYPHPHPRRNHLVKYQKGDRLYGVPGSALREPAQLDRQQGLKG